MYIEVLKDKEKTQKVSFMIKAYYIYLVLFHFFFSIDTIIKGGGGRKKKKGGAMGLFLSPFFFFSKGDTRRVEVSWCVVPFNCTSHTHTHTHL